MIFCYSSKDRIGFSDGSVGKKSARSPGDTGSIPGWG